MKTIYKYELESMYEKKYLPEGAKILSVINQHDSIVFYALVDNEITKVDEYEFLIFGTGFNCNSLSINYKFLGTVSTYHGKYIWHVFVKEVDI